MKYIQIPPHNLEEQKAKITRQMADVITKYNGFLDSLEELNTVIGHDVDCHVFPKTQRERWDRERLPKLLTDKLLPDFECAYEIWRRRRIQQEIIESMGLTESQAIFIGLRDAPSYIKFAKDSPYIDGQLSRLSGRPLDFNPHKSDAKKRTEWIKGWKHADTGRVQNDSKE